jgi:hypothetical protein
MSERMLEWFNGRTVQAVKPSTEESAQWVMCFEGGAALYNYDPGVARPPVDEKKLISVEFGLKTTLLFGDGSRIVLTPNQYAIKDDTATGGQLFWPQAQAEPVDTIVDPSSLRVVDGPEPQEDGE